MLPAAYRIDEEGKSVDVFLSYPSEHVEDAKEVRDFVRSVGLACWFDKDALTVGEDWDRARKLAQGEADVILVLCAAETTIKDGVYQREINEALRAVDDKRVGTIYLLPIRVENVNLPPEIRRFQYLDKFEPGWRRKLAVALQRAIRERSKPLPPALEVAAAMPDEGGSIPRSISENRPEGTLDVSWLQYTLEGDYWDFVNGKIALRALGGLFEARRHLEEWWQKAGSSWELHVTEFHRKGPLVSLIVERWEYWAAAAHPNHGIETINFLGPDAGIMKAGDLFDQSSEALNFVTDYVNLDLRRQLMGTGAQLDLSQYAETYGWELYDHYNFNEAGMRVNLSAASGLPHVLGLHEVYMPWEHVGELLAPVARRILLGERATVSKGNCPTSVSGHKP